VGGLARRATIIEDFKGAGKQLLIVDAGNSLFEAKGSPSLTERKKARVIATAYQRMGYHAVNIGSNDLLAGIEFLMDLQKDIHLPLLSSNILDEKGGKPLFRPRAVLDVAGIRVGLLSLTSGFAPHERMTTKGYIISDPIEAAKREAAQLQRDCHIVVALCNLGSFQEYAGLVQRVEKVDFILGSGGKGSYHQTIQSDRGWKALLFQTYTKGQYLGRIDLKVVGGSHDFFDLSRMAHMEKQIKSIERQLNSYRSGAGSAKSIPQEKREDYIKRLEEFKKRTEAQLKKLEEDSREKSTFISSPIRLDDKVKEDPEVKELVDRFKKGS
jgi:5'-nucleotidase/UDP-sugar diphosphatase